MLWDSEEIVAALPPEELALLRAALQELARLADSATSEGDDAGAGRRRAYAGRGSSGLRALLLPEEIDPDEARAQRLLALRSFVEGDAHGDADTAARRERLAAVPNSINRASETIDRLLAEKETPPPDPKWLSRLLALMGIGQKGKK